MYRSNPENLAYINEYEENYGLDYLYPIVRGKTKSPVEFGMKMSISVVNGYTFIDTMTFNPYNEGEHEEFEKNYKELLKQELKEVGERNYN